MLVTVKLSPDVADALRTRAGNGEEGAAGARNLVKAVEGFGARLVPMHPETRDPELKTYFNVEVPDRRTADQIVATLNRTPLVEAAYWKPAEDMP